MTAITLKHDEKGFLTNPNPPKESSAKPITVNVPSPSLEPTRDVSDRDIAHIATGGISRRF